jgi:hypothetical protein
MFIIIILALCYIIFNLNRKNRAYEDIVGKYDAMLENVKAYMKEALKKLISIDRRQVFESDDDVGYFFKSLKEEIIKLNNNIASVVNDENSEDQTNKG